MRCPRCGATNPDGAAWCGQCYGALADDDVEPAPTPTAPGAAVPSPDAGIPSEPAGPKPADRSPSSEHGFRTVDGQIQWTCVACGEHNPIDLLSCGVCGTSLGARYARPPAEPSAQEWTTALALSAVLPGAGHMAVGRVGTGVARALLFTVWALGGVLLLVGGGRGALAAVPLVLGAVALWGGTLWDVAALRAGRRQQLWSGRPLLWLVVGVTVLLLISALGGAGGAVGATGTAVPPGGAHDGVPPGGA